MQEPHARLGEERHDADRVAGDVGHLGGDRGAAEAAIELLAVGEAGAEEVGRHQLGMRREGQGVPADQAPLDRPFQAGRRGFAGMLEMVEDQPGARRPDEFWMRRILVEEMLAGIDRLRDEALMVLPAHLLGMVGEADVEVRLEDEMDHLFSHQGRFRLSLREGMCWEGGRLARLFCPLQRRRARRPPSFS